MSACCTVDGCDQPAVARGWCKKHYYRWNRRGGDPAVKNSRWKRTLRERFDDKWRSEGDCWIWTGASYGKGYGAFAFNGRMTYAHRAAYELFKGPIPEGLQIDHLCFNRRCVNPAHLEAVTSAVNNQRARVRGVQ